MKNLYYLNEKVKPKDLIGKEITHDKFGVMEIIDYKDEAGVINCTNGEIKNFGLFSNAFLKNCQEITLQEKQKEIKKISMQSDFHIIKSYDFDQSINFLDDKKSNKNLKSFDSDYVRVEDIKYYKKRSNEDLQGALTDTELIFLNYYLPVSRGIPFKTCFIKGNDLIKSAKAFFDNKKIENFNPYQINKILENELLHLNNKALIISLIPLNIQLNNSHKVSFATDNNNESLILKKTKEKVKGVNADEAKRILEKKYVLNTNSSLINENFDELIIIDDLFTNGSTTKHIANLVLNEANVSIKNRPLKFITIGKTLKFTSNVYNPLKKHNRNNENNILFVCRANQVRSVIAEALWKTRYYGRDGNFLIPYSCGTEAYAGQFIREEALEILYNENILKNGLESKRLQKNININNLFNYIVSFDEESTNSLLNNHSVKNSKLIKCHVQEALPKNVRNNEMVTKIKECLLRIHKGDFNKWI